MSPTELNNALEASEKLEEKRLILVKFIQEYGDLFLSVKNNYKGTITPLKDGFLTTKKKKTG
ncbi:MAG: GHKL domain-containing protein, partial [Lachnospiraceae bacterium]|nr:GHKL domain-containing protein [Lachnospiraceae bacterium]